jgi:hypothetical protein
MNEHPGESIIQTRKITQNFKVNAELVDSVDTQQKTVGQERKTKIKGRPIGRSTQKKK